MDSGEVVSELVGSTFSKNPPSSLTRETIEELNEQSEVLQG